MSTYLIGDVHGCYNELITLLTKVKFTPGQDTLWLTGDLVARGPNSLEVLRYVKSLGESVHMVLGNHDLYLLTICTDQYRKKIDRTELFIKDNELIDWLRHQPLLQINEEKQLVMVHAGIAPQWDLETAKIYAHDIEEILSSDSYHLFLKSIFSNTKNNWCENFSDLKRLHFITNVFTRMRYIFPNGKLDMYHKDIPKHTPTLLTPWFDVPSLVAKDYSIVFGHWASLKGKGTPRGIYALDTGCCWGGKLTCLRWEDKKYFIQKSN